MHNRRARWSSGCQYRLSRNVRIGSPESWEHWRWGFAAHRRRGASLSEILLQSQKEGETTMAQTTAQQHTAHAGHKHAHSDHCGHVRVRHEGHIDYLHDGHLHSTHGDHYDECVIAVSAA